MFWRFSPLRQFEIRFERFEHFLVFSGMADLWEKLWNKFSSRSAISGNMNKIIVFNNFQNSFIFGCFRGCYYLPPIHQRLDYTLALNISHQCRWRDCILHESSWVLCIEFLLYSLGTAPSRFILNGTMVAFRMKRDCCYAETRWRCWRHHQCACLQHPSRWLSGIKPEDTVPPTGLDNICHSLLQARDRVSCLQHWVTPIVLLLLSSSWTIHTNSCTIGLIAHCELTSIVRLFVSNSPTIHVKQVAAVALLVKKTENVLTELVSIHI